MTISKAIRLATKWAEGEVCTLREDEAREYHKICLAALRAQQQPNAPLTPDELREMDGEPVWAIGGDGTNQYVLIDKGGNGIDADTGFWDSDFYGLPGDGAHGLNVLGWLAYRHKPEEADHG